MTDTPATGAAPNLQRAIAAFQRHAFAALLAGDTPRVADVAEAASRDTVGVAQAVTWLEEHGELERDFCPCANLFCTGEHVDGWRRSVGDPDGQVLTLAQVPALARTAWADIATIR